MPLEVSNLRFVDVEEGYSGWTNVEIINMDWELVAPCNMDCDDCLNFCVELFLVNNPEAYKDSSETSWNKHSHFHVGESSGTANDLDEIQITTSILTRMEKAIPQESTWNQEITTWQNSHSRMHNLELEASRNNDNPFLIGIEMMVYLSNTQSPGSILSLVQLLSQNTLQLMGLFFQ